MMQAPGRILVFHTAFIGDIILMLPMVQVLHAQFPQARISVVAIPAAAGALENHPAIDEVVVYDKKGRDRGVAGILRLSLQLRKQRFDAAVIPHRSIRSALVCRLAAIPKRVGFETSAGAWLFTDAQPYGKELHETERDLGLLGALGVSHPQVELPALFPDNEDHAVADRALGSHRGHEFVTIAPGSVWNTKRWPKEHFIALTRMLTGEGVHVALVGGEADRALCNEIDGAVGSGLVVNQAGMLTILQSAELIRRSSVLVTNDSAPLHMAVAMRTPTVAIFGATVPGFGFAPRGERDRVVQTSGLSCRPCSIHGGDVCPIATFVCMKNITAETVLDNVHSIISTVQHARS